MFQKTEMTIVMYRIYSIFIRIYSSWALIKFLDLESWRLFEVGAYSRLGAY